MLEFIHTVETTKKAKLPRPAALYGFRWWLDGDCDWALRVAESTGGSYDIVGWLMVGVYADESGVLVLRPLFRFNDSLFIDTDVHLHDIATDKLGEHACGFALMRGNKEVSDGQTK